MGEDTTTVSRPLRPSVERAPGEGCLVVIYGDALGRRVPIAGPALAIGRSPTNGLALAQQDVSREHCLLTVHGGAVTVRDLGSTNGTFLNDRELQPGEDAPLRSGDHVHVGGVILKYLEGGNVEALYHEEIYRTMIVDGLTRVHNRRYLMEFLEREMSRCRRHDRPLSLVLLDVDRFKAVNDELGHLAGDYVLRELAGLILGAVRHEECAARYGGEEFAVVLPETSLDGARRFAERLRGTVEHHAFAVDGRRIPVTVSIGVAAMGADLPDAESFVKAADGCLYEAKNAGRNRVAGGDGNGSS